MTTTGLGAASLPVTLADVEAAARAARRTWSGTPRSSRTGRWPSASAARSASSARTCSAPARSRSAGAYTRIARLTDDERARGRGRGQRRQPRAGRGARRRSCSASTATVFMPVGAPLPKVAGDPGVRRRGRAARAARSTRRWWPPGPSPSETGAVLIHPFDHPDIVAGQGTVGLEILEQCPEVRTIVVGIGGGGLLAGIAAAVKALRPDVAVVGVQAEGAAAYPASLAAGQPVPLDDDVDDGRRHRGRPARRAHRSRSSSAPGRRGASRSPRSDISRALLLLPGAGQAGRRAGRRGRRGRAAGRPRAASAPPVVAVLSGGNIDPLLMLRVIRHGMAAAGRYLSLRLRAARPAGRARGAARRARPRRTRTCSRSSTCGPTSGCSVDEVEVALRLETQGPEHCRGVLAALRAAGFTLQV